MRLVRERLSCLSLMPLFLDRTGLTGPGWQDRLGGSCGRACLCPHSPGIRTREPDLRVYFKSSEASL